MSQTGSEARRDSLVAMLAMIGLFLGIRLLGNFTVADLVLLSLVTGAWATMLRDRDPGFVQAALMTLLLANIFLLGAWGVEAKGDAIRDTLQQILYIVGPWVIVREASRGERFHALEKNLVRASAMVASAALAQYAVLSWSGRNIFSFISRYGTASAGMDGYIRATGFFQHYNHLAIGLLPGFALALNRGHPFLSTLLFLGIASSGSRSGVAGAFLILLGQIITRRGLPYLLPGLAMAGVMLFVFLTQEDLLARRLPFLSGGEVDDSTLIRLELLSVGWDLVRTHPWLGIGIGQFKAVSGIDNLESAFLVLAVENGLIGLALVLAIIIGAAARAVTRRQGVYFLLLAAISGNLLVHPFLMVSAIGPLCWLAFWLAAYAPEGHVPPPERAGRREPVVVGNHSGESAMVG